MKYIDAEKLKCLLDAKYKDFIGKAKIEGYTTLQYQYMADGIDIAEQLIDSLQQERPELQPIGYAETYYQKGLHDGIIKGRMGILKWLEEIEKRKAEPILIVNYQEHPEVFDTVAFQKGVKEGKRLAIETIRSRIDEILGDAQPNPILRMELQELIEKIES